MSRSQQQTLLELMGGLVESQSLAQFQEYTESLLAQLFQADHVAFCWMHPEVPTGFDWRASTTGHFLRTYFRWFQNDFVFQWLSRHPNTAASDMEMLRGGRLEETETYRRSRESHLRLRHVLAVLLSSEHRRGSGAVALYTEGAKPFSAKRRLLLQELSPALSGAFQNFARFGALSEHNQLLEELLRQEGTLAIVLDAQGRDFFRTDAITSLLERWFPSRSDRDDWGIPKAWRERIDAFMKGGVLSTSIPRVWREQRGMSVLEACLTRLPRINGREQWELRLKEVHAVPEMWRQRLSGRQFEAAALVVQGLSDKEVANQLGITEDTAKDHVHQAYRKLGVSSRAGLIALALRP
ncbi:response regulator transcription factor [Pyxidicoccus parkwayensis]|uniref:Response regulator transcription factor n=1 Tax=Pyxidicoccus parkwayensis TaxID=2813578 RepID=A0ABX7NNN0_9BACT|nr:LuxR C-terminal-related transcriptional regulator [Pyxidicoccus parkwaysis]QSQ19180.1 response regulator transcription factor [Pyxidicoccus parkwaysis]